jgi:hypothetical protein
MVKFIWWKTFGNVANKSGHTAFCRKLLRRKLLQVSEYGPWLSRAPPLIVLMQNPDTIRYDSYMKWWIPKRFCYSKECPRNKMSEWWRDAFNRSYVPRVWIRRSNGFRSNGFLTVRNWMIPMRPFRRSLEPSPSVPVTVTTAEVLFLLLPVKPLHSHRMNRTYVPKLLKTVFI